jgi:hypothetical protein
MKRLWLVLCFFSLLLVPSALSRGGELVVIVDSAHIYAEPDSNSYMIETVSKGAVLTLFQKSKIRNAWYYVAFDSKSRKGKVSGFIHDSLVGESAQAQESIAVGQISGKEEGNISIPSPPEPEKMALSARKREVPEIRTEELSVTPPSKPLAIQVITPSIKEVVAFQKISKPPVMIKPKEIKFDTASPVREERAFQQVSEPLVEIKPGKAPPALPSPAMETVAFKVQREARQAKVIKESSITPLPRESREGTRIGDHPDLAASSRKEVKAFQEIVKQPVKIESRKISLRSFSSTLEERAFQSIVEPQVWIRARHMPLVDASPSAETSAYQARKASKPVKVEELSITTFSKEGAGIRAEQSGGGNGSMIPLASPTKDTGAFQEITTPLVEIKKPDLPAVNPLSEMESTVFEKSRGTPQLGEAKGTSFMGVSPSKGKVTLERIMSNETMKRKSPQEHSTSPFSINARKNSGKFKWITLGLGYGQSLGGAGGFIQLNTKSGISFHGGVGYYPTSYVYSDCDWVRDVALFTGGIKYYLPLGADPLRFYLDLQFGGIGVEAAQIIEGIWQYNFVFDYRQKTLWGPSFLGGLELRLGRMGLNGAVGLSYNTTKLDWDIQDYFLTFDLGFLLYF